MTSLLLVTSLYGQSQNDALITDRPSFTSSPFAVPRGTVQLESGFAIFGDVFPSYTRYAIDVNSTIARVGLFEKTEMRFGAGYYDDQRHTDTATHSSFGFAPWSVGFKSEIVDGSGLLPSVALMTTGHFPTEADGGLESSGVCVDALFMHELDADLNLLYQVGLAWWGASPDFNWTFLLSRSLGEKFSVFAELYGTQNSELNYHSIDGGFTYLFNGNFQFDLSGGLAMSRQAPDWYGAIGLSYRFADLWGVEDKL